MMAGRNRPDSVKFPVFSLLNREIAGQTRETGSLQTVRTANQSAFSLFELRPQPDRPKTPAISGFFARDMAGRVTGRDGYLP